MPDRPVRRPLRKVDIPPDAPEADALDQARPVADEDDDEILPPEIGPTSRKPMPSIKLAAFP